MIRVPEPRKHESLAASLLSNKKLLPRGRAGQGRGASLNFWKRCSPGLALPAVLDQRGLVYRHRTVTITPIVCSPGMIGVGAA